MMPSPPDANHKESVRLQSQDECNRTATEYSCEFERKHPILSVLAVILVPELLWILLMLIGAGFIGAIHAGHADKIIYGLGVAILIIGLAVPAAMGVIAWRKRHNR